MNAIDAIKKRLHRDIVANPVLHGLVINLYLNGERYPHIVDDYFPIEAAEPDLAREMRNHIADEDKHVLLYRKALQKLEQPDIQLPLEDVFNEVIRSHTPVTFKIERADSADDRRLKLAHFFAHVHFLEKRVARSLEFHVEACAHSPCDYAEKAVGAVLTDEAHHVAYTREAVRHLLPQQEARSVLAVHTRAERRANLDFSSRQLDRLMRDYRHCISRNKAFLYRSCAALVKGALFCA